MIAFGRNRTLGDEHLLHEHVSSVGAKLSARTARGVVLCREVVANDMTQGDAWCHAHGTSQRDLGMRGQDRAAVNFGVGNSVGDDAGDAGVGLLQHGDAEGLVVRTGEGDVYRGDEAPVVDLSLKPGHELYVAQAAEPRQGVCIVVFEALRDPERLIPVLLPAPQRPGLSASSPRDGAVALAEGRGNTACTNIGTGTTNWGRS